MANVGIGICLDHQNNACPLERWRSQHLTKEQLCYDVYGTGMAWLEIADGLRSKEVSWWLRRQE